MKKIPARNYLLLLGVIILTVFLVFYAREWYNATKEYNANNSVIKEVVREINAEEISNYVIESQKFGLYVASARDWDVKPFERRFKRLITSLDVQDEILYLNLDNVNASDFNNKLKKEFCDNKVASKFSDSKTVFYVFEDGKIVDVIENISEYSDKNIKSFLSNWGFGND